MTKTPILCEVDWDLIAKSFPGRNAKMCYNRHRRLSTMGQRSWTSEDDNRILCFVNEFGEDWKRIGEFFPKRTEKQLKDHYRNYLRPDLDKSEWNIKNDIEFVRLLSIYGCDWRKIQGAMPERSYPQIKNRYYGRIAKIIGRKLELLK